MLKSGKFSKISVMKPVFLIFAVAVLSAAPFLFLLPRTMIVTPAPISNGDGAAKGSAMEFLPIIPEPQPAGDSSPSPAITVRDMSNQERLAGPPAVVKGIYLTGWSSGSDSKINSAIGLIRGTELNAVVIDIKDFSGNLSYKTGVPAIAANGGENEIRIVQPNAMIKKFHDAGIYVIARQTVFQDPILAKAHPEWALRNKTTGKTWTDNKGLSWMDPAGKQVWDYDVAIAKNALERGFDEINFDYVRFASDGSLGQIAYPFWDQKTPRHTVIKNFFKYLRESLPDAKLSADLFGLATINSDDLGMGQIIEDAYKYFDAVSPMVYPSHYASGFLGYKSPAKYPYEVVKYSMEKALARLTTYGKRLTTDASSTESSTIGQLSNVKDQLRTAKLRPWLQDFNLGAAYDAAMVRKQIKAVYDAFSSSSTSNQQSAISNQFGGWLLWNPSNVYTEGALMPKTN